MPSTAGQIVIDVTAGTAKMVLDLEAAKGKLREFGQAGQGSARVVNAEMRLLEGNIANNNRAAAAFLLQFPALANAAKAAFPVFGAVAFIGVLGAAASRVHDFFKELNEAPAKAGAAFRTLTNSIRGSNDELLVANDRLENDIAKLEGKRENTLKLALDEATLSADKLSESLVKDLQGINDILKQNVNGIWDRLIGGDNALGKVNDSVKKSTDGALNALEAANQKIAEVAQRAKGNGTPAALKAGRDEIDAIRTKAQTDANAELSKSLKTINDELQKQRDIKKQYDAENQFNKDGRFFNPAGDLNAKAIAALDGARRATQQAQRAIPLRISNADLTSKDDAAKAKDAAGRQENPFKKWETESKAALDAIKAKLEAIGKSESAQIQAAAFGKAQEAIAKPNNELTKTKGHLTGAQADKVRANALTVAQTEAEIQWQESVQKTSTTISDRIKSQQALTAAIGAGYEATKEATVQAKLLEAEQQHANDPEFLRNHQSNINSLRAGLGAEFDAQHGDQTAKALFGLSQQIELEKELDRVQSQGAEAVRQAALAHKLNEIALNNDAISTKKLQAAEVELYNAARANTAASDSAKINEEIQATDRLTAATLKGAAALREARLENELATVRRNQGGQAIPGVLGITQAELDAIGKARAEHSQEVAKTAAGADPVNRINDEIAALKEVKATLGDTLAIDLRLRDLENERLHAIIEQTLQLGTARAGIAAFFLEMQQTYKKASDIIAETLTQVVDRTSDNLAKLLTEKKPKGGRGQAFGKEFQDIGQEALGSSIKSTFHGLLGKIGGGKADGSSEASALWVRFAKGGGSSPTGPGNGDFGGEVTSSDSGDSSSSNSGILGKLGGLFGGGLGMIKNFIPHFAGGGDADPGSIYRVAEAGEGELITPKNASTVTPLSKFNGRGGDTHVYHIDARGAALGVENRIGAALDQSHDSAVAQSLHAAKEQARRTPRR